MSENKNEISAEYKNAINQAIEEGLPTIFSNHCLAHAEFLCSRMFDETKTEARILTGMSAWADSPTMRDSFASMVKKLKSAKHKVKDAVRVILLADNGEDLNLDWLRALRDQSDGVLSVLVAEVDKNEEIPHQMLCDDRMVRLEKPHGRNVTQVNAKVSFNRPGVVKDLAPRFDALWTRLTS
jgi:ABC-type uncharacterized transport system ATPase subunit